MFWITKKKHNRIVELKDDYIEHKEKSIDDLREALWRKEKFEEICDKLTDKVNVFGAPGVCGIGAGSSSVMDRLDDSVAVYVDDYFGGKVIKQEATSVTIIDIYGKATYGLTKQKPDKDRNFVLIFDNGK